MRPRVVLAGASTAQAAVSFVTFGLPAIGPDIRHEFGLGLPGLGLVLSATLFGSGLSLLAAGVAVDRFGTRLSVLAGTTLAVAGLAGAALAPSGSLLVAALFVSGVGSSVVPIAGTGALFRVYGMERRGWALGVRQMAVPVGGTTAALAMPGLDALGGVRLALAVGAALVGLAGAGFALVSADGAEVHRLRRGIAFGEILRTPGLLRLLVVAALYVIVLQAVLAYTVPAARAAGLSKFAAGATFFAVNVTAAASRLVWGRIADRQGGRRRTRTLVEAGWVAAVGALLFTVALHLGVAVVIPAAVVFGFGALGWNALVYVSAGELAPVGLAGQSVAVAATVVFVLSGVSTPTLGLLAEHSGWDAFWLTSALLAAAGALVAGYPDAAARKARPAPRAGRS